MAATVDMLRLHAGKRAWTLGQQVADFSNNVLAACTASDCLPTLHLLGFLQEVKEREKDGAVGLFQRSSSHLHIHSLNHTNRFSPSTTGHALPARGGHPHAS